MSFHFCCLRFVSSLENLKVEFFKLLTFSFLIFLQNTKILFNIFSLPSLIIGFQIWIVSCFSLLTSFLIFRHHQNPFKFFVFWLNYTILFNSFFLSSSKINKILIDTRCLATWIFNKLFFRIYNTFSLYWFDKWLLLLNLSWLPSQ